MQLTGMRQRGDPPSCRQRRLTRGSREWPRGGEEQFSCTIAERRGASRATYSTRAAPPGSKRRKGESYVPHRSKRTDQESGAKFARSGGRAEQTALCFLDGNGSWCNTEQKQAISICEEVLFERSWSETPKNNCKKTLLRIVEDVRDLHQWHDDQGWPSTEGSASTCRQHGPPGRSCTAIRALGGRQSEEVPRFLAGQDGASSL